MSLKVKTSKTQDEAEGRQNPTGMVRVTEWLGSAPASVGVETNCRDDGGTSGNLVSEAIHVIMEDVNMANNNIDARNTPRAVENIYENAEERRGRNPNETTEYTESYYTYVERLTSRNEREMAMYREKLMEKTMNMFQCLCNCISGTIIAAIAGTLLLWVGLTIWAQLTHEALQELTNGGCENDLKVIASCLNKTNPRTDEMWLQEDDYWRLKLYPIYHEYENELDLYFGQPPMTEYDNSKFLTIFYDRQLLAKWDLNKLGEQGRTEHLRKVRELLHALHQLPEAANKQEGVNVTRDLIY